MPSSLTKSTRRPWVPLIDGDALRAALARKGWTQRDLVDACAKLGTTIDSGNIARAVNGRRGSIGVRKLPVVAKALGLKVDDLLAEYSGTASGDAGQPT